MAPKGDRLAGPLSYGLCKLAWPGACAEFTEVMMYKSQGAGIGAFGENVATWVHL
ncbi:hypothetical protein [Maribacter algicola]|uniref:hypothetical protein n=1 Tax=Maribacter algicola TaxID=2498892 RepID=UPI0014022FE4|nr:hypothetical protein [Maribacter algicola]